MKLYDVLQKEEGKVLKERRAAAPHPDPLPTPFFIITRKKLITGAVALAVLVGIYVLGIRFVHASVVIEEKRIPFTLVSQELQVTNQEKADEGRLSFQAMVVHTTITREVYGSALTTSNTKATGSVVFFNEYSTAKQTVKKGTTLTASNGKKYITQTQVVVPGYTTVNKKKVAGTSPSVNITAAEVGDSYNSEGATLSVAGWSNASKTFYARSAAISGGEAGVSHTLTDTERQQTESTLQAQLIERLKRETRTQIPPDLVTFPELQVPIIDSTSFISKGGGVRFPASLSGTMVTYLIPRALLEQAIAAKAIKENPYPTVAIPDLGDLSIEMRTAIPTDPKVVPEAITIAVSGSGTVITKTPIDEVKERILSMPRRDFDTLLEGIPEIEGARFNIRPFWAPHFPSKWSNIEVITH